MTSSSPVHADDFCSRTHSVYADGFGAAKVSSRGSRRPKARRAFADPFASLFQWAATTLHADSSAFKHPRLVGTPTASGRQKSPRVGRSGPRLVERSPTPSPPLFQWAATMLHTGFSALSEKPPTLWRGVRRRTRALRWEECSAVIRSHRRRVPQE